MTGKTPTRRRKSKDEVQAFLAIYEPEVQRIAWKLRRLVFDLVPDALEQIDPAARLLGYGFAPTYQDTICVIMPLKAAVNLGFPGGVDLADPEGLLAGTGKRARHVKITSARQVSSAAVRALLKASIQQVRKIRAVR